MEVENPKPSAFWERLRTLPKNVATKVKKLGQDDPRRITHSLKVGLALTLVSSFYYCRPIYDNFEESGIWAVITVVVVMEFTVGGTLSKGLNRGLGTLLAGGLGVGAEYLASLSGDKAEPILLGLFVFLLAAAATFSRFFPGIKAKYDYGVLIFILTFSMVVVSGYQADKMLEMVNDRILTILIGGAICLLVTIFVCPVWAGEALHNSVASNIDKLASYLEGFGSEFLGSSGDEVEGQNDRSFRQGFKTVLHSKSLEESLATFSRWEPRHGKFGFRHPWKQYLKIGGSTRQCAYQIQALDGYLSSQIQVPREFQRMIRESCIKMSLESAKALKALASTVKDMTDPSTANSHLENARSSIIDLKNSFKAGSIDHTEILEIIPAASMALILAEIVKCVEEISTSVEELSRLAGFTSLRKNVSSAKPRLLHRGRIRPVPDIDVSEQVIEVIEVGDEEQNASPEKENPESPTAGQTSSWLEN